MKTSPCREGCVAVQTVPWEGVRSATLKTAGCVEVDLVVSGRGIHHLSDQTVPCREGDICVLGPGTVHRYEAEEQWGNPTVRRILFDPRILPDAEAAEPERPRFCYGVFCEGDNVSYAALNQATREIVEPLFAGIARETEKERADRKGVLAGYLSVLLITLSRYMNGAIRTPSEISRKDRALISSALQIVGEDFSSAALTQESVAAALFVSPAHFSRCFKRCEGKSFADHLRNVRMEHACHLLRETDQSVEKILAACGLRDLQTFYRSFQGYAGMTPNQYRKAYNQKLINDEKGAKIMIILSEISEQLQKGKGKIVKEMVQAAIDEGCDPSKILNEGLLDGMSVIGEKFKNNEVYVPEVLVAARAMNMGITILKPYLVESGVQSIGKVCIGTVQGDLHDIGKNIVKMMLEGKGFEVIDLGTDVPAETFVQTAKEEGCQIICCSALLTTTMDVMADVVEAAKAAGIRDQVKIMIGGAPINQEYCDAIGADCYTVDAASAADAAVALCKDLK